MSSVKNKWARFGVFSRTKAGHKIPAPCAHDGGFLIPPEFADEITKRAPEILAWVEQAIGRGLINKREQNRNDKQAEKDV